MKETRTLYYQKDEPTGEFQMDDLWITGINPYLSLYYYNTTTRHWMLCTSLSSLKDVIDRIKRFNKKYIQYHENQIDILNLEN